MAKDQITLLTSIAAEMKRQNQFSIRQNLENKEYQQQQLAQQAGDKLATGEGAQIIDDATDFKRRVKASLFTAKMAEKITDSGKRAKDTVKENKEKEKQRKLDKKNAPLQRVLKADKYVGKSTIVDAIEANNFSNSELTLSLIKVNSDAIVHSLGGIRHVLGMQSGNIDKARRAAIKVAKAEARDRADAKRDAEEARREAEDKVKDKAVIKVDANVKTTEQGKGGGLASMLIVGAIAAAGMAVKNIIAGWKKGGFFGAIKALFFGNGKGGIGNAIAAAFGTATTFATAGLLIGGPVGALIGGILGLAVGAFTGYFGTEKIKGMLADVGTWIGKSVDGIIDNVKAFGIALAHGIYKPGVEGKGGPAGNTTMGSKAKLFGHEVNWTISGIGKKVAKAFSDGWDWLTGKVTEWALQIYDPTTNKVLGGLFTMPKWFDGVEKAVSEIWNGMKNFGTLIKNTAIRLLPDWFTDRMGWTINGKIPSEVNTKNPHEETGGNVWTGSTKAKLEAQKLEVVKANVHAYELAMANYTAMTEASGSGNFAQPDYADFMDRSLGSKPMGDWLTFAMDPANEGLIGAELKAAHQKAFPELYADEVLAHDKALILAAELKKKEEEAKKIMLEKEALEKNLSKLDKKMMDKDSLIRLDGDGGGKFVNHTDASSNVGAVVVQNIYALDQPIGPALISIHDHMDLNYGAYANYSGYN